MSQEAFGTFGCELAQTGQWHHRSRDVMEKKGHATISAVGAEPQPGPCCTQLASSPVRGHETMGQAQP